MSAKEKIKSTLLQLLDEYCADDITIKLLCLESGLSKQTFYYHYRNLTEALNEAYQEEFMRYVDGLGVYQTWVEGFRKSLEFLLSKKKMCLHLYFSSHQEEFLSIVKEHGSRLVSNGIDQCSRDIGITISEKDRDFMLNFYMHVFMGIVRDYFDHRMQESPEYLASRCDAMMRFHIRNTLKNLKDMKEGTF